MMQPRLLAAASSTCLLTVHCLARASHGELEPSEATGHGGDTAPKARLRALSSSDSAYLNVTSKLWDGLDLTEEEHMQLLYHWRGRAPQARASGARELPEMQLLGPPDAGTNLLHLTVWRNWPDKVTDDPYDFSHIVWKHSISSAEDLCERYTAAGLGENFTLLFAIRSPISQLTSWHKAPYNFEACMSRSYSEMGKPCFANVSPDWYYKKDRWEKTARSLSFANSMDIYNQYLRQYTYFANERACRHIKTLFVRYEDLVLTPEAVVGAIARKTGWGFPVHGIHVIERPAKDHGDALGREDATEKLRSRRYLAEIAPTDLAARCDELQASLLSGQYENSFSQDRIPYMRDCHDARERLAASAAGAA